MRMVGFNFEKISAERNVDIIKGKVKINQDLNIKTVNNIDFPEDKTKKIAKISFDYTLNYTPKIGKISFEGNVLYMGKEKEVKEAQEQWKKDKKLNPGLTQAVLNHVLFKSTVRALNLAEEVGLPPHIPLPKITPKVNPEEYIG